MLLGLCNYLVTQQASHFFVLRWTEALSSELAQEMLHGLRLSERQELPSAYLVTRPVNVSLSCDPAPGATQARDTVPDFCGHLSHRDFKLLRRLGSGQFAAVFLAVHKESGNPFAVKVSVVKRSCTCDI